MIRKATIFLTFLILLTACSFYVYAEDSVRLKIHNADFTTGDENSTYIEGEVSIANGQDIVLKQSMKTIARISIPKTGHPYEFRVKVPASSIKSNSESVFRVQSMSSESTKESLPVKVRIKHKPKKSQTITTAKDNYKLSLPGLRTSLKAKVASGDSIEYVSDNPEVVKIDEKGNLIPVGKGKATVSLTVPSSSQYQSASKEVSVSVEQKDGYLVAFHSSIDGQEDQVKEQLFSLNKEETLDANTFENGDNEFLGWATEDGGVVKYDDAESVNNLTDNGKTADLYAVWTGDGAPAAVAWAVKIANDDTFNYGDRPATAAPGCYFCGTNHGPNRYNKPKGYEKTYVCMTFVHAAYAHGARDPEMLHDCQGGRYTLSLHDWNFSHWSCWEKVGRCSNLSVNDLEPGDVIIWWADNDYSGHASIYAGDGDIVDAGIVGWGSNSIAVRKGQAAKYLSRGARHSKKSYVMRYVKPEE